MKQTTLICSINFNNYIINLYSDVIGLRTNDNVFICGRFLNSKNEINWTIDDIRYMNPDLKTKCDEIVAKVFKMKAFL